MENCCNLKFKQGVRNIDATTLQLGTCPLVVLPRINESPQACGNPRETDSHIGQTHSICVNTANVYTEGTKEIHLEEGNEYPTEACSLGVARTYGRI
jgi:hypothetical protein